MNWSIDPSQTIKTRRFARSIGEFKQRGMRRSLANIPHRLMVRVAA